MIFRIAAMMIVSYFSHSNAFAKTHEIAESCFADSRYARENAFKMDVQRVPPVWTYRPMPGVPGRGYAERTVFGYCLKYSSKVYRMTHFFNRQAQDPTQLLKRALGASRYDDTFKTSSLL